jgi:ubiquinone/menaquinone biosynthesis C-methylase UbiE
MIFAAQQRSVLAQTPELIFNVGDMEAIDYPAESFDLIISNLSLQWLNSLERSFQEIARVLKPDGRFVFSTVLQGSLIELHQLIKKLLAKQDATTTLKPATKLFHFKKIFIRFNPKSGIRG